MRLTALKVACEDLLDEIYADRFTSLRPQVVAGPHDPSGRHTYWVCRTGQGGEVLAPGDGSDFVQVIDVCYLARFTVTSIEEGLVGAFNMAGLRLTWADFLRELGMENLVWISAASLREAGLHLPLVSPLPGRGEPAQRPHGREQREGTGGRPHAHELLTKGSHLLAKRGRLLASLLVQLRKVAVEIGDQLRIHGAPCTIRPATLPEIQFGCPTPAPPF